MKILEKIPEEKAKELIKKFGLKFPMASPDNFICKQAKECALIATNEVIDNIPMYTGNLNPKWKFWDDVRTVLNAL